MPKRLLAFSLRITAGLWQLVLPFVAHAFQRFRVEECACNYLVSVEERLGTGQLARPTLDHVYVSSDTQVVLVEGLRLLLLSYSYYYDQLLRVDVFFRHATTTCNT